MADLPHVASGLASLEPAGIAAQQANQPASSDKGKLRVFISYSRDDLDFADQLDAALDFAASNALSIAKASPVARTGSDASAI